MFTFHKTLTSIDSSLTSPPSANLSKKMLFFGSTPSTTPSPPPTTPTTKWLSNSHLPHPASMSVLPTDHKTSSTSSSSSPVYKKTLKRPSNYYSLSSSDLSLKRNTLVTSSKPFKTKASKVSFKTQWMTVKLRQQAASPILPTSTTPTNKYFPLTQTKDALQTIRSKNI